MICSVLILPVPETPGIEMSDIAAYVRFRHKILHSGGEITD
jgi:hypothetical protein